MLSARDRLALGIVGMNASLRFTPRTDRAHMAELALDHAVGHGFERASVLSERRLLERALVWGIGSVTPDDAATRLATLATGGEILRVTVEGETLVTTRAVLEEEHHMLATVRDGRGTRPPLKADHVIEDEALSAEQCRAVRHAVGLGHIEDVDAAESQHALRLLAVLGVLVLLGGSTSAR